MTAINKQVFSEAQFRSLAKDYKEHIIEFKLGEEMGTLTGVFWGFLKSMAPTNRPAYNITSFKIEGNNVVEGGFRVVTPEMIRSICVLDKNFQNWLAVTPDAKIKIASETETSKAISIYTRKFFGFDLQKDGRMAALRLTATVLLQLGYKKDDVGEFIRSELGVPKS